MTKVFYVEDNEDNIFMLSRRLKKKGFDVSVARNGQEALDMVEDVMPDLILMDLGLPVLDGWEATRRIKSMSRVADIPIIVLTAHAMEGDREKALATGANDYDTKPVDLVRLLGKMTALLG